MARDLLLVHDGGNTSAKFKRAVSTFAEARDFRLVTEGEADVSIVFVETGTVPAVPEGPVAVCLASGVKDIRNDNIFYGSDVPVTTEPADLMRWLEGLWPALDKAGFPSRFPQKVTVTEGAAPEGSSAEPQKLYDAELVGHELLTAPDYPRPSYMLTIDYKDAPLTYVTGDHLIVMPENKTSNVERLLSVLDVEGSAVYTVTDEAGVTYTATAFEIFKRHLGIQGLGTRKFLATMALLAEDAGEAATLNEMATNMGKDSPYATSIRGVFSYVDILDRFKSCRLTMAQAVAAIPAMRPRSYSCSCSPLRAEHQVQLAFTLVTYPTADGATFEGTNTAYMRSLKIGDKMRITIKPGVRDPTVDMPGMKYVAVALGSGVAPLRGVAQHFHLLKQKQEASSLLLYYGVRHREKDYMFGTELEEYAASGALALHTAFSHDQEEFITPATLIGQDPETLCKVLVDEPQARFFYCGPSGPAIEVTLAAIKEAVRQCRPDTDYDELVATMRKERRWYAEAYLPAADPENPFKL